MVSVCPCSFHVLFCSTHWALEELLWESCLVLSTQLLLVSANRPPERNATIKSRSSISLWEESWVYKQSIQCLGTRTAHRRGRCWKRQCLQMSLKLRLRIHRGQPFCGPSPTSVWSSYVWYWISGRLMFYLVLGLHTLTPYPIHAPPPPPHG